MGATGLREQGRERRRIAITQSALRLFAERGYDATTVAEIAEAAGVSARTVPLYFPTKLDLALSYTTDAANRFAEVIHAGPREPITDLCAQWLKQELRDHAEILALHRAMLAANPALRGAQTREVNEAKAAVGTALAAELGRPLNDPVVALVGGVMDGVSAALLQLRPEDLQASGATLSALRLIRDAVDAAKEGRLDR